MEHNLVHGYRQCKNIGREGCQGLVLAEVLFSTAGLCSPCWLEAQSDLQRTIDVIIDGRTSKLKAKRSSKRNRRSEEKRAARPDWRERKSKAHKARDRACRLVAAAHPLEYHVVYAMERARGGLDPWPVSNALAFQAACREAGVDPSETLEAFASYDAGDAQAQDVEAPSGRGAGAA